MFLKHKAEFIKQDKSAQEIQDDIFRRMSANDKLAVGAGLWRLAKEIDSAKIDFRKFVEEKQKNLTLGFGLIGLIIVVAIIGLFIGGGLYLRGTQNQQSLLEIGLQKEKEAEALKQKILQQQKDRLDSIGESSSPNPTPKPSPQPTSAVDTSTWKTYRNEKYGFEVRYPNNFRLAEYPNTENFKEVPPMFPISSGGNLVLLISIPVPSIKTNLKDAAIGVVVGPVVISKECYTDYFGESISTTEMVNGIVFSKSGWNDSATGGNFFGGRILATNFKGQCYRLVSLLNYMTPGVFHDIHPDGKEYQYEPETSKYIVGLNQIFSTFKFIK